MGIVGHDECLFINVKKQPQNGLVSIFKIGRHLVPMLEGLLLTMSMNKS
jgi:hypothetical protein